MAFISVFDVIGPNMIGPSSSHTAGADSLAFLAQKMINGPLKKVDFTLYGSFAKTYRGHGTDRVFWAVLWDLRLMTNVSLTLSPLLKKKDLNTISYQRDRRGRSSQYRRYYHG